MSQDDDQANITPLPAAKSAAGEFFVVDRRAFAAASALGLNPAVAYLTIARGAGSRATSLWSVDAIERYTGISRPKARLAVENLIEKGLLTRGGSRTRPVYGIVRAHEMPGLVLSVEDRIVFELIGDAEFARIPQAHIRTANNLVRRGFLANDGKRWFTRKDGKAKKRRLDCVGDAVHLGFMPPDCGARRAARPILAALPAPQERRTGGPP